VPNPGQHQRHPHPPSKAAQIGGALIGPAFLVLALGMFMTSRATVLPNAPTPVVQPEQIAPVPRRTPMSDPPTALIAGFEQRCNDCHRIFESTWDGERTLEQHQDIVINHGINENCFNCHVRDDRELLVLQGGKTTTFSDVTTMCAQCHGPIHRDWRRGVHGKTLGYWNAELGPQHKLTCTECHDPHSPGYPHYEPLPGPNTLRMGDPGAGHHAEVEARRNPLRRWADDAKHNSHEGDDHR